MYVLMFKSQNEDFRILKVYSEKPTFQGLCKIKEIKELSVREVEHLVIHEKLSANYRREFQILKVDPEIGEDDD